MLKIKDSVDLKELEKYGFENVEYRYEREIDNCWFGLISIDIEDRSIIRNTEEIGYWCCDDIEDFNSYDCKYIKDLIEAGLVEKVKE